MQELKINPVLQTRESERQHAIMQATTILINWLLEGDNLKQYVSPELEEREKVIETIHEVV
jgi:hypothetical protein